MNTQAKKRKSVRVDGPKLPATRVARASTRRQVTGPDTSPGAITEGVQAAHKGEVLLYQGKGGIALEVRVQGDTVWLTTTNGEVIRSQTLRRDQAREQRLRRR